MPPTKLTSHDPAPLNIHELWLAAMRAGDWEAAWRQTDRVELPRRAAEAAGSFHHPPEYLLWNGASFAGRDVFVRCNHGLGDTIQFARFLPMLAAVARSVTVLAQPPLVELLAAAGGMGTIVDGWNAPPATSSVVEVECMELAYAFRVTPETLPCSVAYFSPERMLAATRFLPMPDGSGRRKVGVLWGASAWDVSRSIPLGALAGLGEVRGVEFYSLQQGAEAARISEAAFPLRRLGRSTEAILDAAAAMLALDLVITVDTMAAHLAGALGRPVWLLLQAEADWRWMAGRTDSPWYPTMRIFRRRVAGEWGAVVEEVAAALGEMANDQWSMTTG